MRAEIHADDAHGSEEALLLHAIEAHLEERDHLLVRLGRVLHLLKVPRKHNVEPVARLARHAREVGEGRQRAREGLVGNRERLVDLAHPNVHVALRGRAHHASVRRDLEVAHRDADLSAVALSVALATALALRPAVVVRERRQLNVDWALLNVVDLERILLGARVVEALGTRRECTLAQAVLFARLLLALAVLLLATAVLLAAAM